MKMFTFIMKMILNLNKSGFCEIHFWFMPQLAKLFFIILYTHHHGRKIGSAYGHAISQLVFVVFQVTEQKHVHLGHMDTDYVQTFNIEANVFRGNHIKKSTGGNWKVIKTPVKVQKYFIIIIIIIFSHNGMPMLC